MLSLVSTHFWQVLMYTMNKPQIIWTRIEDLLVRTSTWSYPVILCMIILIKTLMTWFSDEKNHFKGRFLGFQVYVSNTTNKLDGHLCFRDTNYNISTILPVANISCPVHGKYVIYYNERLPWLTYPGGYSTYAFNELCEVEVYGKLEIVDYDIKVLYFVKICIFQIFLFY